MRFKQYLEEQDQFYNDYDKIDDFMHSLLGSNLVGSNTYTINDDLTVSADTHVFIRKEHLNGKTKLPIQFKKVNGSFHIDSCGLDTLKGCPTECYDFNCSDNPLLKSLEFGPSIVKGGYDASYTNIASLEHAPTKLTAPNLDRNIFKVRGCSNLTGIESFKGVSDNISQFLYSGNVITSLVGINEIFTNFVGEGSISFSSEYTAINDGGLGLVLIPGFKVLYSDYALPKPFQILKKYFGRPDDVFDCQNELIEAGYEEYAQL